MICSGFSVFSLLVLASVVGSVFLSVALTSSVEDSFKSLSDFSVGKNHWVD